MKKKLLALSSVVLSSSLFAEEVVASSVSNDKAFLYLAGILGVALAASVGAYAQSKSASAALEGIARNPAAKDALFIPMLLALALNESLVIFTMVAIFLVK